MGSRRWLVAQRVLRDDGSEDAVPRAVRRTSPALSPQQRPAGFLGCTLEGEGQRHRGSCVSRGGASTQHVPEADLWVLTAQTGATSFPSHSLCRAGGSGPCHCMGSRPGRDPAAELLAGR